MKSFRGIMQEANLTYKIRSRNPIHEPKPFLDSANNSIEHWEVLELKMQLPLTQSTPKSTQFQNGLFSNVRGLFVSARNRVSRFFDVYDQDNE